MGTPDFASNILQRLSEGGYTPVLAVTNPDRVKGRGKQVSMSPVAVAAKERGIPLFQPEKIKAPDTIEILKSYEPDLIIVAAYGHILPKAVLELGKYGAINVHASLLPKYRGASPIQSAILNGEKETGVSIMQMDEGMDTGDILMREAVPISPDETGGSLFDKLSMSGAELCLKAVEAISRGALKGQKQKDADATYTKLIEKDSGRIDFQKGAAFIERMIRAYDPWPAAFTTFKGQGVKFWRASVSEDEAPAPDFVGPGTVNLVTGDAIHISTGRGSLIVKELQLSGKKRMSVHDFLLGKKVIPGDVFGT